MKQLTQLPDLAKSFAVMKIGIDLGEVIPQSAFTIAIRHGIKERKISAVLEFIKDVSQFNRKMVINEIGEKLLTQIENL